MQVGQTRYATPNHPATIHQRRDAGPGRRPHDQLATAMEDRHEDEVPG